ncbi:hypothetical protein J6590_046154 [Homalodisca vitripennis]|nr:hypothetical protein J6590_046154 [Homalodisca vitripennis]
MLGSGSHLFKQHVRYISYVNSRTKRAKSHRLRSWAATKVWYGIFTVAEGNKLRDWALALLNKPCLCDYSSRKQAGAVSLRL